MNPQEAPRASRADVRRRHLLDSARALFNERGFHQTGVAQIASASGVKVGQIYRDFESKEAIIAAICEADAAAWLDEDMLQRAVDAGDVNAIREWIRRFSSVDSSLDECRMILEIIAEAGRNERVATVFRAIDERVRNCLSAALAALVPGPAAEREALIEFILAVGSGLMSRRIVNPHICDETLGRRLGEIIEREIDRLAGQRAGS